MLAAVLVLALAGGGTTAFLVLRDDAPAAAGDGGDGEGSEGPGEPGEPQEPDEGEEPEEPEEPEFRDWLPVRGEIMVGKRRYLSPCQLMTVDDVAELYELDATVSVQEVFADVSRPVPRPYDTGFDTSCLIGPVDLQVRQFASQDVNLFREANTLGEEDEPRKLRVFRKAARASGDEELVAFVEELARGAALRRRLADEFDQRVQRRDEQGVLLPTGWDAYSFTLLRGTAVHELTLDTGQDLGQALRDDPEQVAAHLDRARRLLALVQERAADPELPQAPAPTILGDSDRNGPNPALEACSVLDRAAFQAITGRPANREVRRVTPPLVIDGFEAGGEPSVPSATCERRFERETDVGSDEVSVWLQLGPARSVKVVNQILRRGFQFGEFDRRLRSKADHAARHAFSADDDNPVYVFREGPYLGVVRVSTLRSTGLANPIEQGRGDDAFHIRAIDTFVAAIRRDRAVADRDAARRDAD